MVKAGFNCLNSALWLFLLANVALWLILLPHAALWLVLLLHAALWLVLCGHFWSFLVIDDWLHQWLSWASFRGHFLIWWNLATKVSWTFWCWWQCHTWLVCQWNMCTRPTSPRFLWIRSIGLSDCPSMSFQLVIFLMAKNYKMLVCTWLPVAQVSKTFEFASKPEQKRPSSSISLEVIMEWR